MPVCAVCKKRTSEKDGLFFHACDDWLHLRLFVCRGCQESMPLQQSLHEMCYECVAHLSCAESGDPHNAWFAILDRAIGGFEQSHEAMLKVLPFSAGTDCVHPGSTSPWMEKWRDRFSDGQ